MKIAIITLAGENITDSVAHLSVNLSMNNHCQFTLHYSEEDRAGHFIGTLSASSQKWICKPFEVVGLFKGIVTSVSLSRVHGGKTNFVIQGQSPTILLDDGPHTRSFGEKPLKQILDKVIGPYEGGFEGVDINPQMGDKIKYCVQYKESNFAFMNRLAARYGEWFYYDGAKLNLGKAPSGGGVRLNFPMDVIAFNISAKAVPVNFKLKTYDYKKHKFPTKTSDYSPPANPYAKIAFDKAKGEIFSKTAEVPINIGMNEADLEKIKKLRENVHLSELVVLNGTSRFQPLKLGSIIKVVDNREGLKASGTDDYGEYIITRLTHEFTTRADIYTNHFEAIPKDSKVPPLTVSPDPPYCEVQEAEVLKNFDDDGLGRVRVQFHWQKGLEDPDDRTNWIRVISNSAGGTKGLYLLPEIGDTVLVAFEHDNPERAYVLSSTYHGTQKPEHHDTKNWKKALKTKGGHQFLMNDEKGKEKMDFFSPKDFAALAKAGQMDLKANKTITIISDSGKITISTPADISIDSTKNNITITAKEGKIRLDAKNIEIHGEDSIKLTSKKIDIEATTELNANAPKVTIEGKATADLKGLTVSIDGSTLTNVKGGIVKIN